MKTIKEIKASLKTYETESLTTSAIILTKRGEAASKGLLGAIIDELEYRMVFHEFVKFMDVLVAVKK